MANIERTIEIIFGATDNTGNVLSGLASNIDSSVDQVSNLTEPLSNVANNVLAAEAAILGLGVAMLGVAVNDAAKFQTSLNEIGTLFNATPEQVAKLGAEVIAFGKGSVFSIEDINTSLFNMISATGDVTNAVDAMGAAQTLAALGATSLDTSVNALTTVINSYGDSMTTAGDVSDTLFVTVQNGKTTLQELSASLGGVTSIASSANIPFSDLGAAIATLTAGGVNTATTMTLLNAAIKELADPSDKLSTAMGGLSLQTDGIKPVMEALKASTGGTFVEMNKLFGSTEATKAALILANDASGTFTRTLDAMADKTGAVTENFKLMEDNLNLVTQNMVNNLNAVFIEVGNKLLPEWTQIIKSVSGLFDGISISLKDEATKPLFDGLNELQQGISDFITGIGTALPDAISKVNFDDLANSFSSIGSSITGLFGGLDLTDADDLAKALQFMVDSVESLNLVVKGIVVAWQPAIETIITAVDEFNKLDDTTKQTSGNVLGISQVFEQFKGILTTGADAISLVGNALTVIAGVQVANTFTSLGSAFTAVNFGGVNTVLSRLVGLLTGPAGLVAAAGAAGFALSEFLNIPDRIDSLFGEGSSLGSAIYDLFNAGENENISTALVKIANTTPTTKDGIEGINEELDRLQSLTDTSAEIALVAELKDFNTQLTETGNSLTASEEDIKSWLKTTSSATETTKTLTDAQQAYADKLAIVSAEQAAAVTEYNNLNSLQKQSIQTVDELFTAFENGSITSDGLARGLERSALQARVLGTELTSVVSSTDFKVDSSNSLEKAISATERLRASFSSLNTGIDSNNTLISDILGSESSFDRDGGLTGPARRAIDEASIAKEKQLVLQNRLVTAEENLIKARTALIEGGVPEIIINTEGLEPALELIFTEIIEKVQLKASADGLGFLLGVGT